MVAEIVAHPDHVGDGKDQMLADLLAKPAPAHTWGRQVGAAALANASEARLVPLLLAQVGADREQTMNENTWRSAPTDAARWLSFLATTGYTLAPIEAKVVDDAAAKADSATGDGDDPDGDAEGFDTDDDGSAADDDPDTA